MPDTIISRLSATLGDRYRIERELGAGGMATVYLAHDIKHDRDVAIKVLHPDLGAALGGDRFLTEIKTTAKLQHPHILPLLDSGDAGGLLYYVMPVVTGETLRARLERERQLPIADAVRISREIASALDYAHRQNVIHRDIKPENILLHDGQALVADFGIALAVQTAGRQRMTQTGLSLGTPQYMSPEQAMGEKTIDARSDVYALAAVTYEMLTGDPPFTGSSVQAILAKVMSERPTPLHTMRDTVPLAVEHAVLTALAKLPADRFATAAEFSAALANPNATTSAISAMPISRKHAFRLAGVGALVGATLVAGLVFGLRPWKTQGAGGAVIRTSLSLGDSVAVRAISDLRLAISPRGNRVVFVGASGNGDALWMRELDQPAAHLVPDTKGAFDPFMSPDGNSIAFFTTEGGKTVLKVIATDGAGARTVLQDSVVSFGGGWWGDDGNIYFTNVRRGLSRVPSGGGAIEVLAKPDSANGVQELDFPEVLPGCRFALVMLWKGAITSNRIGVVDLRTGKTRELTVGTMARFVAPGYLAIGMSDGKLFAAPFNAKDATLSGTPVMMLPDVQVESGNGTVQFAASGNGTVVYQQRVGSTDALIWVDRSGRETPVDTTITGAIGSIALSPDANQIALTRSDLASEPNIWVKHLVTGAFSRLSLGMTDVDRPVWKPDGRYVGFLGRRSGALTAWVRRADGSDSATPLVRGKANLDELAFDPSGKYTLFRSQGVSVGTRRLLVMENGRDTIPRPLITSPSDHYGMILSPDGKWLAYVSEESGAPEVYVRPFPNTDSARFPISAGGGGEPVWARDGRELFFRNSRGAMFAVPVTTGSHFANGMPKLLFSAQGTVAMPYHRGYDVHPDGKRFLMVLSGGQDSKRLEAIFNWQVELQSLKASGK